MIFQDMRTSILVISIALLAMLFMDPDAQASSDTLWIESQVVAPGYDYSFPIYGALHQQYSGFEIPLTFTSYDLVFDSATLDNSIVPGNFRISTWQNEDSSGALIIIFPYPPSDFGSLIGPSGGRICNVYFHVRWFAPDQLVFVDTAAFDLYDEETGSLIKTYTLSGYDDIGFSLKPEFVYGTISIATAADEDEQEGSIPDDFELFQNYPNPFNSGTRIGYALPYETDVVIEIYNLLGERIVRIEKGLQHSGYHEIEFDASGLKSGYYFYRIRAGDFTQTKKMLFLK
jgi:hypothetical protein